MNNNHITDIETNLLDYYLEHGANGCARRFGISTSFVIDTMREVGVPIRPRGGNHHAARRKRQTGPRLTDEQRAALIAEYRPGVPGELTRLSKKYDIRIQSVAYHLAKGK